MVELALKAAPEHEVTGDHVPTATHHSPSHGEAPDHFVIRDGVVFAGTHLTIDLWGAKHLDEMPFMEEVLKRAISEAQATLLHIHLHHFTPNGGISGVAVLAESHISVHTWPERDFAAFDVFMCGSAEPAKVIHILDRAFSPQQIEVNKQLRGVVRDRI
ncbi:adenosylmethionine decarboxylase [Sansalvadorimonas sp. 2012CJ34-2]|uniref:S-adenosylmethionine decarboxylase proenzyme n=1 Tax=Parendozoicomonas callyspongiae TaxID=2942213 RepID=A0ABT0PCQ2_9GAMM|nr:adenosylmethionine decarboxylase [Sansalvadorimonas sp. 2012CJ34-2]MCL6268996.1 adenosylmethionine decarboxylase [Sansalvadorimonas sp. 2012CJ34-2]